MNSTSNELILLLQELLFDKQVDVTITDQNELYKQAKDNGLSGSIYEVLTRHVTEIDPRFQKDFYLYVAQDQKQLSMINHVTTLFSNNKIEYKLLKGSIMKSIFKKSYYRSMGDVDILIKTKDIKQVTSLLTEHRYILDQEGPVHDHYQYGDLELEVHKRLRQEDKWEEYSILDNYWDIDYPMETELLFLLFHLKKHLYSGGIGLRSVIDISLYVNHHINDLDLSALDTLLNQTNTTTFFHQLIIFNDRYLDLDLTTKLSIKDKFNEQLFETFTDYIIRSGVHGLGVSFNNYIGKLAADKNSGYSRKKSFIKQVFLPYDSMKYLYPKLLKIKLLLPLAWALRIIRVLFTNTKQLTIKLKQYKVDDNEVTIASNLFNDLGI